jgi:hypothetical protein
MQKINRKIQCKCGHLQGSLSSAAGVTRLRCYCRDCQAYAHALDNAERVLNELGGTDVVTTLQQHLSLTKGAESLACLSLSEQGILRWYASCCNTPIGNTARDPKLSYVALVHTCLSESVATLDAKFGAARVDVNTKHAKGKVKSSAMSALFSTARIIASVLRARANGTWKHSPFFRPGSFKPVATPRVLSAEERKLAYKAAHT